VPLLELAEQAGLSRSLDEHVRFISERVKSGAANAAPKLTSIIAGMAAGADSIDDLDVVRSGGMKKLFGGGYAGATLGIVLREFTHGHVRQLSVVLRRFLVGLAARTSVLAGITDRAYIDIDSLLRPVYGHAKQGASYGHTKIAGKNILRRGLSPLAVSISTDIAAPVVAGSGRASRFVQGRGQHAHRGAQHRHRSRGAGGRHPGAGGLGLLRREDHRRGSQGRRDVLVRDRPQPVR
jgi:hypothetical protein